MTIRLIHGALVTGVVMFGLVAHFVMRPTMTASLPPVALNVLLGVALATALFGCLVLRNRVPRRSTTDSADLYWSTAMTSSVTMWAVLEAGALASIVAYLLTGAWTGAAAAAINLGCMVALRPGHLEQA